MRARTALISKSILNCTNTIKWALPALQTLRPRKENALGEIAEIGLAVGAEPVGEFSFRPGLDVRLLGELSYLFEEVILGIMLLILLQFRRRDGIFLTYYLPLQGRMSAKIVQC